MTAEEIEALRHTIRQYEEGIGRIKALLDIQEGVPEPDRPNPLFPPFVSKGSVLGTEPPVQQPPPSSEPQLPTDMGLPLDPQWHRSSRAPMKSETLEAIENWEQLIFRPAMATAMLYVIMPVIEKIIMAQTSTEQSEAIQELDVWGKLTVAQRLAITELFAWVHDQLTAEQSLIPHQVLANMAAASSTYDNR